MTQAFGRYQIKTDLGTGGMARVYLAVDPRFEREVAIKVLPPDLLDEPALRARFSREAKVIASLEHPAIVPVYDFGEQDGQPFLVMRYMRGGTLKERMAAGSLSMEEIREVISRIASALEAAHQQGVIHRDVKPANILYDTHGNPHLSDFGIVKLGSTASTLTGESVIGTPAYMSPEQARGERALDARTDVYSLGAVLYELLAGEPPYDADTPMGIAVKHVTDPVPDLGAARPDLSSAFSSLIEKAMAKQVTDRFETIGQLAKSLADTIQGRAAAQEPTRVAGPAATVVADGGAAPEPTPRAAEGPPAKPGGRSRLGWLAIGLGGAVGLTVLAIVGVTMLAGRGGSPTPSPTAQPAAAVVPPTEPPPPPTATLAPTDTIEAVGDLPVIRADFQAAELAPEWRWIREPAGGWTLSSRPGWLTLQTQNASLFSQGGDAPVLLRWRADGDFQLVSHILFEPSANFQGAGILAYADDDHFVALSRAYCDASPTCVGDGAYLDTDQAAPEGGPAAADLPTGAPVLLQLSRQGDQFSAHWSPEGDSWNPVGTISADLAYPYLGVFVADGRQGAPSVPASFEFLELTGGGLTALEDLNAWTHVVRAGEPVRLALLGGRSDAVGAVLEAVQVGAELALEDYGPVQGFPVVLEPFDSGCTQAGGEAAVRQLLEADSVIAALGPICSRAVEGALPLMDENRITMISASATRPDLGDLGAGVFNRVILHDNQPGSQVGLEANDLESVQAFYQQVESRTGIPLPAGFEPFAAYGYDAMGILLRSLDGVALVDPQGTLVIDRLELSRQVRATRGFEGLTGRITFEPDGDRQP